MRLKAFGSFFAMQSIAYLVLVTNIRAIAHLQYQLAATSEMLYLVIQWTVLKRIVAATSRWEQAGYVIGGAVGTLISMWLTKGW